MEKERLSAVKRDIRACLTDMIIPFWLSRSVDKEYGGYITDFDENGNFSGNGAKYIVTQSRMVWGFSDLLPFAKESDKPRMAEAAAQGMEFLTNAFWDKKYGGFYWYLNRDASINDASKLTYGESFAIYALSAYYLRYKDAKALEFAKKCFDLLQIYSLDSLRGGYYENVERDWTLSPFGAGCGDRKSLDIHMHLLEAFTTLRLATGEEIHARRLREVLDLIMGRMVDGNLGFGYNQFDLNFNRIPAVNIPRTWNAERETNEVIETPADTTSYGHNVELSWLAGLALDVLGGERAEYERVFRLLLDHSLKHGYDYDFGGVYRDGVGDGPAVVTDKEWWQNFEAMCGYLDGYERYRDDRYLDAFERTWRFIDARFINHASGESRQLLSRDGSVLVGAMGNPWKGIYHTGRALAETIRRMDRLGVEG